MAGVIQVARFASVDALRGEGMELQAVAVTVIGGTLLSGGYGSVDRHGARRDHLWRDPGRAWFWPARPGISSARSPGFIVVAAVILNTSVARRMARSRPLAGFRRGNAETRRGARRCVGGDGRRYPVGADDDAMSPVRGRDAGRDDWRDVARAAPE